MLDLIAKIPHAVEVIKTAKPNEFDKIATAKVKISNIIIETNL